MNKNPVPRALFRRLRLCTLLCFIQFAVINDGYTYFLHGVQPAHPASSLQSVLTFTLDAHKNLALGGSFAVISEAHSLITRVTLKSLEWIQSALSSEFRPVRKAQKIMLAALPGGEAFDGGERLEARREDYIGGKKESWTKLETPRLDDLQTAYTGGWDGLFVDEVISTARQALLDRTRPGGEKKNFMQRIHYSSGDEPAEAVRTDGIHDRTKSPGSFKAGWLFYYGADFARGGAR